jgi:GTP diphosphokinase / guanosine-3',5'-bis(diphosphate) 3'-diphosphatase
LTSASDTARILAAARFAAERHKAQRRKGFDQEPYVNHLIDVAELLSRSTPELDANLVIAGFLHDTIEDVGVTRQELADTFSDDVASLVAEVTDDKNLPKPIRKALQVENAPKKSPRAQRLGTADKIANLRSVLVNPPAHWSFERRREYFAWARRVVDRYPDVDGYLREEFEGVHAKFADFEKLAARVRNPEIQSLRETYLRIADIPVVLEQWTWDGIQGSSAVFLSDTVQDWSDKRLLDWLTRTARFEIAGNPTPSRKPNYTFVRGRLP